MKKKGVRLIAVSIITIGVIGILYFIGFTKPGFVFTWVRTYTPEPDIELLDIDNEFAQSLVDAAIERTHHAVRYDPAYIQIEYPMGDVPDDTGVCTDVVIRSYRQLGIDLQQVVHEDMVDNFSEYPNLWGLGAPDTNIDHRRVPNLMVFFKRYGTVLPITDNGTDYAPGDLVTWDLGGGKTHIGIVTNRVLSMSGQPLIVHNVGRGPQLENALFRWKIIGHFRYVGDQS